MHRTALYVWYYGGEYARNMGLVKQELKTDMDLEEAVFDVEMPANSTLQSIEFLGQDTDEMIAAQMEEINKAPGQYLYKQWLDKVRAEDDAAMRRILSTKVGREAYERQFHTKLDEAEITGGVTIIPPDVFMAMNDFSFDDTPKVDMGNLSSVFASL